MLNKVMLIGRLGGDPELKYTQDGSPVANFSIATSERWKDKQTGEKVERTEWHRVVAWNRLAEICGEYLEKGKLVYIEGSIHTRGWVGDDDVKRYATDIKASVMKMMPGGGNGNSEFRTGGAYEPPFGGSAPGGGAPGGEDVPTVDDDDIPF